MSLFDFQLAYQPVFKINGGPELIGYEVLLRFKCFKSPLDGLRELKKLGLLPMWELQVVEKILERGVPENDRIFLNLTPQAFLDYDFYLRARNLTGNRAASFCIEIPESELLDGNEYKKAMGRWLSAGCYVGIDDFGTRGANLDLVLIEQPHFVKVDRLLVNGVALNPDRRKILFGTVDTLCRLNIFPIFEGIELKEDFSVITNKYRDIGIQGYLLGKPEIIEKGKGWSQLRNSVLMSAMATLKPFPKAAE